GCCGVAPNADPGSFASSVSAFGGEEDPGSVLLNIPVVARASRTPALQEQIREKIITGRSLLRPHRKLVIRCHCARFRLVTGSPFPPAAPMPGAEARLQPFQKRETPTAVPIVEAGCERPLWLHPGDYALVTCGAHGTVVDD